MNKVKSNCKKSRTSSNTLELKPTNTCLACTIILLCVALPSLSFAATYYVDPATGSPSNNGNSASPWRTIQEVFANGLFGTTILPGDTVLLRSGYHGYIDYSGGNNSDYITIAADTGHTPQLRQIEIDSCSRWVFRGLAISPELTPGSYTSVDRLFNISGTSQYITIEQCSLYSVQDSSNWSAANWTGLAANGIYADGANLSYITVRQCNVKNVEYGIMCTAKNALVERNTVENFYADGLRGGATDQTWQYNTVKNSYQVDGTHRDCIQLYTGSRGDPARTVIRGNIFIGYDNPDRPFTAETQGISLFDPPYSEITIENNIVITEHTNAIIARDAVNSKIVNNIVFSRYGANAGEIDLRDSPQNTIVRNNIAYSFPANSGTVTSDHNLDLDNYNPDDLFVDWQNFDLRPKAGSPAIDAGSASDAPNIDIAGTSRPQGSAYDIGAYEGGTGSVDTTPPSTPQNLTATATSATSVQLSWQASQDAESGINHYNIYRDSALIGQATSTSYSDTNLSSQTSYSYQTSAVNGANLESTKTSSVSVTTPRGNTSPVLAAIGNKSVNENAALTFTISATDADGDTLTYSATNRPSGSTFSGSTFSWTPTYTQAGTYQVTFSVSDGRGGTDSEIITITVSNVNRLPVLASIGSKSTNENALLSFTVSATDADGDTITYSTQNLPSGAAFANRTFTWTPGYNQAGTHQVTFVASDGQEQDSEIVTITVVNVNRAPVLATISGKTAYATDLLSFTISATDPDGDTLTYSAQNLPSGATFANRTFNWTPSAGQVGTHQVTFAASDGTLQDSETITITVRAADTSAPKTSNLSPAADSIQAPLNSLVVMHITDAGIGVDAASVSITLDGSVIYTGDTTSYTSSSGRCSRAGSPADYTYIYQPNTTLDYDQTISVAVNASDLASNAMSQYSYSFQTEMRSFGKNKSVNSDTTSTGRASPATVRDSSGNIYAVWHSGTTGARNIYFAKLLAGQSAFSGTIELTANSNDQCNPVIAIDTANKLYLVWQDNRNGNWDIYGSTSLDGINWSTERKVSDSNNNEINPAIIIDKSSPPKPYVAWQDDSAGNQEIFIASSSDSFATNAVTRITTNTADQTEPALAATAANVVYVLWTDLRNGSADIYAAASNSGPWSNVPVVTKSGSQTSPAIAAESAGSIVHLLWVDDSAGNRDIFYASSTGLTGTTLTGTNIIDDASGKDQIEPAITATGTGSSLKVFACWQDKRNISGASSDSDLYFVQTNSGSRTNIFVGDDSANSNQSGPAIAMDAYGNPYIVWVDDRNSRTDIYYAASTFVSSTVLASASVTTSAGATIGTNPAAITGTDDVSIIVPAGGVPCTVTMSISKVNNPSNLSVNTLSPPYDFCPSGLSFDQPVTITIPYATSASGQSASACWYNTSTGQLSQQGITDVQTLTISPTLMAVQFKTTHFTQFVVVESAGAIGSSGGGGGGGCSMGAQANPTDFFLPYAGLGVVMVAIKRHDVKKRHSQNRSR
jgi:hypothetical protein